MKDRRRASDVHRLLCPGLLLSTLVSGATAFAGADLVALRDGFDVRRDAMFQLLAGKPLLVSKKRPPLGPGRTLYTRHYSFSITSFAMKAMWLGEQLDAANAALVENCTYYIGSQQARDDRDSFYWAADVLCRLVEFFGTEGTLAPGRLAPETEEEMLEMMWLYCRDNSRLADADVARSRTWHIHESENHHIQRFATLWHFCRFLKGAPAYSSRTFTGGGTAGEHYTAWTVYSKEFLRERVRKGLFVEMANKGYNVMTLKGIYNFHDFADDADLRTLARDVLDLYWSTWAEEQIDGVRGGGASRVYQGRMSQTRDGDAIGRWAGFYLGQGTDKPPRDSEFTVLTSGYRMPLVVMDLALDSAGRGVYEVRQRRLGLVRAGYYRPPDYRLRPEQGGIVRYSYCTPEFVMGTAMLEARPLEDWAMISSQNRWHGVIFAGHEDARIYPQCDAKGGQTYNQQWSAQSRGTLIAQKLRGSTGARDMCVWFAKNGLSNRQEKGGWVFCEAQGAYAAVLAVDGGYEWDADDDKVPGTWLRCRNPWSPVVIEVARKADAADYAVFRQRVLDCPVHSVEGRLTYTGLCGDTFTFHTDQSQPPAINGTPVDYAPAMAFDSPFVKSRWGSGRVTIRKGARELVIDVGPAK